MRIRDATDSDVPAILAIYNDVVTNTTAIYDERPSTLDERKAWFDARRQKGLPVLVGEINGEVVGFSTFGDWRSVGASPLVDAAGPNHGPNSGRHAG